MQLMHLSLVITNKYEVKTRPKYCNGLMHLYINHHLYFWILIALISYFEMIERDYFDTLNVAYQKNQISHVSCIGIFFSAFSFLCYQQQLVIISML